MDFEIRFSSGHSSSKPPAGEKTCIDIIDYAIKEHEIALSNFDSLDNKAGGIVQFVGIILGLSAFQNIVTGVIPMAIRLFALLIFAISLVCALYAWCVRRVEKIPSTYNVKERFDEMGSKVAESELIPAINKATRTIIDTTNKKSKLLKASYLMLVIASCLLVLSLALSYFMK